jgi:hypothetical protein
MKELSRIALTVAAGAVAMVVAAAAYRAFWSDLGAASMLARVLERQEAIQLEVVRATDRSLQEIGMHDLRAETLGIELVRGLDRVLQELAQQRLRAEEAAADRAALLAAVAALEERLRAMEGAAPGGEDGAVPGSPSPGR